MRAVPLAEPSPHPAVGLVALDNRPVPLLVRALFDTIEPLNIAGTLGDPTRYRRSAPSALCSNAEGQVAGH